MLCCWNWSTQEVGRRCGLEQLSLQHCAKTWKASKIRTRKGNWKGTGLLDEWTTLNGAFQEAPFPVGLVGVFFMPLGRKDMTLSVENSFHTGFCSLLSGCTMTCLSQFFTLHILQDSLVCWRRVLGYECQHQCTLTPNLHWMWLRSNPVPIRQRSW